MDNDHLAEKLNIINLDPAVVFLSFRLELRHLSTSQPLNTAQPAQKPNSAPHLHCKFIIIITKPHRRNHILCLVNFFSCSLVTLL